MASPNLGAVSRLAAPVLLDLGNVLVAVHFDRFTRRAAHLSGRSMSDIAARWVHGPAKLAHERGETTSAAYLAAMGAWLGLPPGCRGELIRAWCDIFEPVPGAAAAVSDLARRGPVWLLSDTNPLHLCWCRRRWPWLDLCARRLVSWQRGALKADPGAFAAVVAASGRPAAELVFVDDLPANVDAARAAGLDAHLFRGWEGARRHLGLPPDPAGSAPWPPAGR